MKIISYSSLVHFSSRYICLLKVVHACCMWKISLCPGVTEILAVLLDIQQ